MALGYGSKISTTVVAIDPDEVEYIPAAAASTYAKIAAAYGEAYYNAVAQELSTVLSSGDRILDIGTGPGILPLTLASTVPSLHIDAFDFTRELIEIGYANAGEIETPSNISFFTADCYQIPVRDQTYTGLVSTGVIHSLDEPVRALNEWYRVLETGGRAWIFDPVILDLPDSIDIDLTATEREILETYGVRRDDPLEYDPDAARKMLAATPFHIDDITRGTDDDLRLYISRR